MVDIPNDNTLYDLFEEKGQQMIPEVLMPYFEEDVHDLVEGVKNIIQYILSGNPHAHVDVDGQVVKKLEVWKNSKEKHLEHKKYLDFAKENSITHERIPYARFVESTYYERWRRIKELGIKIGSVVRIKGRGDDYTVRGISAYLTVGVNETNEHFNPNQIVSVVA